jgi:hypothetical protein
MKEKSVSQQRRAKIIYRPWTVDRIFSASPNDLVRREWELTHLLHKVQNELHVVENQRAIKQIRLKEVKGDNDEAKKRP